MKSDVYNLDRTGMAHTGIVLKNDMKINKGGVFPKYTTIN